MGKATALDDELIARPLTAAERGVRKMAVELGDRDVQPTLDGTFVKQAGAGTPVEVLRAPEQTWD